MIGCYHVHCVSRTPVLHWLWQLKFVAAKTVNEISDKMLHTCGGSGYKVRQLGKNQYYFGYMGKKACI